MHVIGAVALVVAVLVAPQALPTAAKYGSCEAMLRDYPAGVARDSKAASRAVANGMRRPKVNRAVYEANRGQLDRDKDFVTCEQTA